ncbi:MAG: hypothetical protein HC893_05650 [Chloroflexaceae bacterium]|nr:hypothetical protein [Chloroflexaceae bacterium]
MTSPLVTIVILHWRGAAKTLHCLERVQQLDYAPYHVILVDNGALPAEMAQICAAYPAAEVLVMGHNRGLCGGGQSGNSAGAGAGQPIHSVAQ